MKTFLTLVLGIVVSLTVSTTALAGGGGCGACPVTGEKAKEKPAEDAQS